MTGLVNAIEAIKQYENTAPSPPRWTRCDWDDKATRPTLPGVYAVMIAGDSETDGPHVYYAFDDYQTFATISIDEGATGPDDDPLAVACRHDEEVETIIAWFGPLDIPPCDCLEKP